MNIQAILNQKKQKNNSVVKGLIFQSPSNIHIWKKRMKFGALVIILSKSVVDWILRLMIDQSFEEVPPSGSTL